MWLYRLHFLWHFFCLAFVWPVTSTHKSHFLKFNHTIAWKNLLYKYAAVRFDQKHSSSAWRDKWHQQKKEALHSQCVFYLVLSLVASLGHEQHGQDAAFQRCNPVTGLMCWLGACWRKKRCFDSKATEQAHVPVWRTLEPFSSEVG